MTLSRLPRCQWLGKLCRYTRKTDRQDEKFSYECKVIETRDEMVTVQVIGFECAPKIIAARRLEVVGEAG